MSRRTVITLDDGIPYATVECFRGRTALPPKRMKLREIYNIISLDPEKISPKKEVRYTVVKSPILAQNGVARYVQHLTDDVFYSETVLFVLPKERHDTQYFHKRFKAVGFPRLLFLFRLKQAGEDGKKVPVESALFALKDGRLRDDTPLYFYPYSNASPRICWGNYGIGGVEVKDVHELRGLPYAFLGLEKNDDLFSPACNKMGAGHKELLKMFANRDFDDEVLVHSKQTLGDLK